MRIIGRRLPRHVHSLPARAGRRTIIVIGALLLTACGVPEHMLVEKGEYPQNVDQDVRFRTTYYFRVFDYCWSKNGEQAIIPETDTLYRYRMTGKAHSLWTQVKFESGILRAADIDPFGADVVFDGNINGFRVRSPAEAHEESLKVADAKEKAAAAQAREASRAAAFARYQLLQNDYVKLPPLPTDATDERKKTAAKIRSSSRPRCSRP